MFEFSEMDHVLMHMVHDGLVELSVDENGEFIFFCTEEQKDALAEFQSQMEEEEDEQGW